MSVLKCQLDWLNSWIVCIWVTSLQCGWAGESSRLKHAWMFCGIEYNCVVYPTVDERVNPQSWCLTERLVALCTTVALFSTVGCATIWYETSSFSRWIVALTVCQWVTENLTKSKFFFQNQNFFIPNPKLFSIPFFSETNTDIFFNAKNFWCRIRYFFFKTFSETETDTDTYFDT